MRSRPPRVRSRGGVPRKATPCAPRPALAFWRRVSRTTGPHRPRNEGRALTEEPPPPPPLTHAHPARNGRAPGTRPGSAPARRRHLRARWPVRALTFLRAPSKYGLAGARAARGPTSDALPRMTQRREAAARPALCPAGGGAPPAVERWGSDGAATERVPGGCRPAPAPPPSCVLESS